MVLVHLLGMRKIVEDQLFLLVCMKLVGMKFGPLFQWFPSGLQVVTWPPRLQEESTWLFRHMHSSQSVGVIAHFSWQLLSLTICFGVPVVLLTMIFKEYPKHFPWLRKSRTYLLKLQNFELM